MARLTNWLDAWKAFDFKGLRKSELNEKKTEIKEKVKDKLKALDKNKRVKHTITLRWRKLSPTSFKLVANITPPEERGNGGTGSVVSPKVPPQP